MGSISIGSIGMGSIGVGSTDRRSTSCIDVGDRLMLVVVAADPLIALFRPFCQL